MFLLGAPTEQTEPKIKMKRRPGASMRLSSRRACSQQVAYVVSWLNEAQMKPCCASTAAAASWGSIRAVELSPVSPNEVGGLLARVNPYRNPLPLLRCPPDSKRHAHTRRNVRAWRSQTARIATERTAGRAVDERREKNPHLELLVLFSPKTALLLRCELSVSAQQNKNS